MPVDYNALKAQTLGSGADEAVTVNTRALIDKVLARYSGDWTVLRELLQNAADANATKVTVKFETLPSTTIPLPGTPSEVLKHVVQYHTVKRLLITNNGTPFSENDWSRLKRIAEGNPDETKIGAFGVGFYSVFADCEEPFIMSGNQAMAFHWKGNSLYTRRSTLDATETTFMLDYRNTTSPVPSLMQISQFLATSLSFVGIEDIEFWVDTYKILSLSKKSAPTTAISIPKGIETTTKESMMKIDQVSRQVAQIDGSWMAIVDWKFTPVREPAPLRSFFSKIRNAHKEPPPPEDVTRRYEGTVFLLVTSATVQTSVSRSFSQELERATKKPPPKNTKVAILTSPMPTEPVGVFATILPAKSGRIFIGFPTHQTTGLRAHLSAPSVIPTVERESIDLNARWVRTWNAELLRVTGILCRIAWSAEMASIQTKLPEKVRDVSAVVDEAVVVANTFSFHESTPSDAVRRTIEDAFWTCNTTATIEILSTRGVLPNHEIRIAPTLAFLELPTVPERLAKDAKPFVDRLIEFGLLTDATPTDIAGCLERSALSVQQLQEFFSWLGVQYLQNKYDQTAIRKLLAVTIAEVDGKVLVVDTVKHFVASKVDLPVPPSVIPFALSKSLSAPVKEAFGWRQLQLLPWVEWLLQSLTPDTAAKMLALVSKQWDALAQDQKDALVAALSPHAVVPTKLGMRKPSDAYFPSVKVFDDLPVVALQSVKERLLVALGVRKTLELSLVFSRIAEKSHVPIIQYLASVQNDIPAADLAKLKSMPLCPKEGDTQRYTVSSLYEPDETLRELNLPILAWDNFRKNTREAHFLAVLGLKSVPSVEELIAAMADRELTQKAMGYFVLNHYKNGYNRFDYDKVTTPFLPVRNSPKPQVPSKCFTDLGAGLFGFDVLDQRLHPHAEKFGVMAHAPISKCVSILIRGPVRDARAMFSYLAGRLNELNADIPRLSTARFIPIGDRQVSPQECFLGGGEFEQLFDYVDFGADANSFLYRCGVKREPSKAEISMVLVTQPQRIFDSLDVDRYTSLLASLADSVKLLRKDKPLFAAMKKAPFLLVTKYVEEGQEEKETFKEWQLARAADVVLVDDFASYQIFRKDLLAAPQERLLEDFYGQLGAPRLSELVEEQTTYGGQLKDQRGAENLRDKILERSRLFLHEQAKESIRYDTKWLEKNLRVVGVSSIRVRRRVRGTTLQDVEERSAATTHGIQTTLWISGRISYYEISQCLVHLLLQRPTLHHPLTLEMLLTTDLKDLGNRGFNVTRILRQKEAERRAERQEREKQEKREKQEQERRELEQRQLGFRQPKSDMNKTLLDSPNPDEPSFIEKNRIEETALAKSKDKSKLKPFPLYELRKSLGLSLDSESAPEQSPPQTQHQPSSTQKPPAEAPQRPNATPLEISRSLTQAIHASRNASTGPVASPESTQTLTEPLTYCDLQPGTDLVYAATSSFMKIFLVRGAFAAGFVAANRAGLDLFATLLQDVVAIFPQLDVGCVSIFYAENEQTIAFNRGGSIFANYAFFKKLHQPASGRLVGKGGLDALLFWWVTMCHELAHNLVHEHSARHSYYLESFVTEYMGGLVQKMAVMKGR